MNSTGSDNDRIFSLFEVFRARATNFLEQPENTEIFAKIESDRKDTAKFWALDEDGPDSQKPRFQFILLDHFAGACFDNLSDDQMRALLPEDISSQSEEELDGLIKRLCLVEFDDGYGPPHLNNLTNLCRLALGQPV